MDDREKLHIAMFPWLAYGHLMPFLEVSDFLAQKGHRISFISTPKNLRKLPQNLSPLITLVELPLPHVHGLPNSAESTAELPNSKVPYLKKAYDMLEPSLTEFLSSSDVDCIVYDFVPYWVPRVASRLGVSSVFFSIYCATSLAFVGPPSLLIHGRGEKPEDWTVVPEWMNFPTKVAFRLHEMLNHQECMDSGASDFLRLGESLRGCNFVTLRSCSEFEAESLSLLENLYAKPVVPVGLLPPRNIKRHDRDERWSELKQWLDSKEEKSVFYIAFGTEVTLSQDQTHELALGVEKSGLPFVWVVAEKAGPSFLPPGFKNRVLGRGFVWTGWAPQLDILAHLSTGGFLTHCGWSSAIEALGFGRPLILFSGANSDQGLVARLLDERCVGMEVPRDEINGSFTSDSVADTVKRIMAEPEGEQIRANAWAMRYVFGNGELQDRHLDEFTKALEKGKASTRTS